MTEIDPEDGAGLSMKFLTEGVAKFAADMRDQGIHMGINGFCPVDGEPWPCRAHREPRRSPGRKRDDSQP